MRNTELERAAYMSGNLSMSDVYDQLSVVEENTELEDIDNALDMLGLSGVRGNSLLAALEHFGKQHASYKQALLDIKDTNRLPKSVTYIINELDFE